MAVSDDEEDGGDADLRKVVVVNPFFAEKHLGPRATHPDGTLDTKAQLTSLWVLGDPTRPRREPRPLDPPGVVLRRPQLDPKMCGCLPTKCGPCHPGGPPESDLGSRRGTVSSWGDDSEAYARAGSLCGPDGAALARACVPEGAFRSKRAHDGWSSDGDVDPASARILKEQRETRRPAPEPGAPREPPPRLPVRLPAGGGVERGREGPATAAEEGGMPRGMRRRGGPGHREARAGVFVVAR